MRQSRTRQPVTRSRYQKAGSGESDSLPLRGGLLDLQRRIGNQAVGRLVQADEGGQRSSVHSLSSGLNAGLRSSGQPLRGDERAFIESRLGHDVGHVLVHTGREAANSARAVNSKAYTVGRDIVFGQGWYAPHTAAGKQLLAHEVIHSLQQQHGASPVPSLAPASRMEQSVDRAAHDVVAGRQVTMPAPTGVGLAREFRTLNVGSLDNDELQREYDMVHMRLLELGTYPERTADEEYLDLIVTEIMRRPGMQAASSVEAADTTVASYDEADAEFWIEPPRLREGARPIFDEENGVIVGFRYYSGGYWEIYNLYGEMVESGEIGLEAPLIDPIDILAGGLTGLGRGLIRGGGRAVVGAAAGGAGRGTAGTVVKAGLAVTIRALSQRAITAVRGVYRVIRFRGPLNFTTSTARHMATAGRRVPHHTLKLSVRFGKRVPDPRGVQGAFQYTVPMIRNGQKYTLEVVLREADQTVLHFLYR